MKSICLKREDIFALSPGMLAEREANDAKEHLEGCANCRKVFEDYLRLDSILEGWAPAAEPSPWFDARLRAAVAAAKPASASPGFRTWSLAWTRWLALSALAAMLVGALVTRHHLRLQHQRSAPAPVQVAQTQRPPAVASEAAQELKMYQNLPVLEDYDMLANFDVISELPKGSSKVAD
jgi:hypothetical protein